jgi:hypothetical protein
VEAGGCLDLPELGCVCVRVWVYEWVGEGGREDSERRERELVSECVYGVCGDRG